MKMRRYYMANGNYVIVMEYLGGPQLFDHIVEITQYNEAVAAATIKPVFEAIRELHRMNILHLYVIHI